MRAIKPETLAARGGLAADGRVHSVVPPLDMSTTFARDEQYQLAAGQNEYIRGKDAGALPAEQLLAQLESGHGAALFASGTAAAAAIVQSLSPGDRIVAPRVMYWGLRNWMLSFCQQWGISIDFYCGADLQDLHRVLSAAPTTMLWLETPSNPTWDVIDIHRAAEMARAVGAASVVDATVSTPVISRPLTLGADLVFHSATKYLNGHSDVLAGAVVTAEDSPLWRRVLANRVNIGGTLGAFEAWLLLRGMRTLYPRVRQASSSALQIAQSLSEHPKVAQVAYPGLPTHPGHAVAAAQMHNGFGGMLSIRVHGGAAAALRVAGACQIFLRATSLGGVESLIEHRHSIEGPDSPIADDLLRISIGIEAVEDLLADLHTALEAA